MILFKREERSGGRGDSGGYISMLKRRRILSKATKKTLKGIIVFCCCCFLRGSENVEIICGGKRPEKKASASDKCQIKRRNKQTARPPAATLAT